MQAGDSIGQRKIDQNPSIRGMTPREPRRAVLIQARMRIDGARFDVCIRNISSRGMLLQAATAPSHGTYIEIFCGYRNIVGRVVWSKHRRFGIQTQDRLDIDAVIEQSARLPSARELDSAARLSGRRRSASRKLTAADVAQRHERSRHMSTVFEFGCFAVCGAAAAVITAGTIGEVLSRPLQSISSHLPKAD